MRFLILGKDPLLEPKDKITSNNNLEFLKKTSKHKPAETEIILNK